MSEEEKKAVEGLKDYVARIKKFHFEQTQGFKWVDITLNLLENQQKELNNLKKIEQSHKEENGKLRVELEQEKEKNNELEIELSTRDNINVDKLVEKYKYYRRLADSYQANCISKDKIKEKYLEMEQEYARKVYDNNYNRTEVKKEEMYKRQVYEELLEEAE